MTPLRKPTPLRQQVYDRLRADLRRGRFRPGERMTEAALAADLDVSRTPVREALGQLAREGLLTALPRGGFRLPALDERDIAEMFEVRTRLEPYAAARAAAHAKSGVPLAAGALKAMRAAIETEKQELDAKDPWRFSEANRAFREALFSMAGNRRLSQTIAAFEDHVQYVRWVTLADQRVRQIVLDGQSALLAAVESGDEGGAEAAMTRHLAAARTALTGVLAKCRPAPVAGAGRRRPGG